MVLKLGPHGILIEKFVEVERKLNSGIIIPKTQKQSKPKARVVAVGTGTKQKPMEAKPGDVITYVATTAREVEAPDGNSFLLIDSENCLYID